MSRGHDRERRVKVMLEAEGWLVIRAAGSLGVVDLIAMREDAMAITDGSHTEAMLIEVKSTAGGPYERFGPAQRAELVRAARQAGAEPWLCWWPPRVRAPQWIPEAEWPQRGAAA